jgi:hypothetical protein
LHLVIAFLSGLALESQVFAVAQAAAHVHHKHLEYSFGSVGVPVDLVVAPGPGLMHNVNMAETRMAGVLV